MRFLGTSNLPVGIGAQGIDHFVCAVCQRQLTQPFQPPHAAHAPACDDPLTLALRRLSDEDFAEFEECQARIARWRDGHHRELLTRERERLRASDFPLPIREYLIALAGGR